MKRGEITGHLYGTTNADVGMPMRSLVSPKKDQRKNISVMDDITNNNESTRDNELS